MRGPMQWPWKREPLPTTVLDERRVNEELSLISRRLKLCDDTLRSNPDDPDALFAKAVFLAKIREYRRSLQCLERVAELEPQYPGLWRTKATIHTKLGETRQAEWCRSRGAEEAF